MEKHILGSKNIFKKRYRSMFFFNFPKKNDPEYPTLPYKKCCSFLLFFLTFNKYILRKWSAYDEKIFWGITLENIETVIFSSSVQAGDPSPPFRGWSLLVRRMVLPFNRTALHKEDKSWVLLGLPFIRRKKVGFNLGCNS